MVVFDGHEYLTEEEKRLKEDRRREKYWKKWGPYVAERQWATGEWQLKLKLQIQPQLLPLLLQLVPLLQAIPP